MTKATAPSEPTPGGGWRGLFSGIPLTACAVAAFAALIPVFMVWHAQSQTPEGWRFTGNVAVSPDLAQYRAWMRQAQETGVLVDNRFTTEPNQPYIPVPFYYVVGRISQWTGQDPEFVYIYAGAVLGFVFGLLLFATIRVFFESRSQVWWIFVVILFGGGLGAHLKILSGFEFVQNSPVLRLFFVDSIWSWPLFEDYRSHYVFVSLFDPHFVLIWLLAVASVLSLYYTLEQFSLVRLGVTMSLYAASAFVHFYEGPLLLLITVSVALLCWWKSIAVRPALLAVLGCGVAVAASNLAQVVLYRMYGLPASWERAVNILASTLFISYPLGWMLIAIGLASYWRSAGLKQCLLLGWLLGCTAWTLSGPFNPFPDRGTMTLQIAVYLVGAGIYFSRWTRVTPIAALAVILVLGVTPAWMTAKRWKESFFTTHEPFKFMSADHDAILDVLRSRTSKTDVLLADEPELLWLGPEYPGRHYCGHWFLCVDYPKKSIARARFFAGAPADEAQFLEQENIRFLFVGRDQDPERFARLPNLALVKSTSVGSLFERTPVATLRPAGVDMAGGTRK